MSRGFTADFIAQLISSAKSVIIFFEGEFASGTVNLWTGIGDLPWDNKTWTGTGTLGKITPIEDATDIRATGITVSLTGMSTEIISIIMQECRTGKPGKVWLGFMDDAGAVIADPSLAFVGRLDVPGVEDAGQTCSISIAYENKLRDLERARELRYTHENQQRLYPGDLGFEYVPSLQEWNGKWGRS